MKKKTQRIASTLSFLIFLIVLTNCVPLMLNGDEYDEKTSPQSDGVIKTPKKTVHQEPLSTMATSYQSPTHQEKAYSDIQILRGINLGNALEAPNPGDWGVTIKQEYFQIIREAGFNAVRIPVRFSEHTGMEPTYLINEPFFELVDNVLNWGLGHGLAVILDFHHFSELMEDPIGEMDKFLAIWAQISERYQNFPANLYFELLNEPHHNLNAELWNDLIDKSIAVIRKRNPTRKILVGGVNFSDIDSLYELRLPEDDNLIATFHYYEPFTFTHQGASWELGSSTWLGTLWQGTRSEKREITLAFERAVNWSISNKVPVIIGEFGVINQADPTSRAKWIKFIVQEAERHNLGWLYWVFCSDFGIYDCQNKLWYEGVLDCLFPE